MEVRRPTATCLVAGSITGLLKVAVDHGVVDLHTHDPDLEQAFMGLWKGRQRR